MSTTDIAVNLDMLVHVMQWVLQTWDEIRIRSCHQGAEDTWAGSFDDNRTGSSKPHPFCKVFRLMTTGGVGSDGAKTRNLFG